MSRLLPTNQLATWNRRAQFAVVLCCALALKLYYSAASANQLRWILGPTTALVELVSGRSFSFESNAGYLSDDRSFLIAAPCAGVNFLITAFLMLALRKLWTDRSRERIVHAWPFIPLAALIAYLATLVANTTRISIALWLRRAALATGWLSGSQLHRLEGILVYFGFLLLLYVVSEKLSSRSRTSAVTLENAVSLESVSDVSPHASGARRSPGWLRRSLFPLLIYYATALGIPLANSIFHGRIAATDFWEHSIFVLLTPLFFVLIIAAFRLCKSRRGRLNNGSEATVQTARTPPCHASAELF
jgi:exosortase K